jgi:hypothetical protein
LNRGETAARFFAKSGLYLKFFQKNKVVSIAGHKKRIRNPAGSGAKMIAARRVATGKNGDKKDLWFQDFKFRL